MNLWGCLGERPPLRKEKEFWGSKNRAWVRTLSSLLTNRVTSLLFSDDQLISSSLKWRKPKLHERVVHEMLCIKQLAQCPACQSHALKDRDCTIFLIFFLFIFTIPTTPPYNLNNTAVSLFHPGFYVSNFLHFYFKNLDAFSCDTLFAM